MRRQLAAAASGILLAAALAGCSGADEVTAPTSALTASVTQSAPSVWSPPETVTGTTESAAAGSGATADPLASSVTALPGLSTHCTTAIHAQAAVNSLFAAGLATPPADTDSAADETAGTVGSDTLVAATTAVPTPTVAASKAELPTRADVESLFDKIGSQVPASLAAAFDTLKAASLTIVGKNADDVSDILSQKKVTAAMQAVSDFVAACKPTTTQ